MEITFQNVSIHTIGHLPKLQQLAPDFTLVNTDLNSFSLKDFLGKKLILNVFVSIDTSVCQASVKKFNKEASLINNTNIICASLDLPFAFKRFCAAENIENVTTGSAFRNPEFGENYGLTIIDGPLRQLLSRAVIVIDTNGKIAYSEQVPEITQEPNYENALTACRNCT